MNDTSPRFSNSPLLSDIILAMLQENIT